MSEPVYSRAPGVVWRLGPDRVLVRRIGAHGDDAAADLLGEAALVWIALDEPATTADVIHRTAPAAKNIDRKDLDLLADARWLVAGSLPSGGRSATDC